MNTDDIDDFARQSEDTADETARAFEEAGERIARALEQAARSGELSFRSLAESVAQDLARLAINELLVGPLQAAIGGAGQGTVKGAGGAAAGKPLTINMNISGAKDTDSFARSQGQISAALARAVHQGGKYL